MTFELLKKEISKKEILSIDKMETLLNKYHNISSNTKSLQYVENNILPVKIGNDKIGNDTAIINMSTCLNCYSFKMGYCNAKCYGKGIQCFRKNSLLFGMASEIMFHKMSYKEIKKQIVPFCINNNIEYLRFNEFGDMSSINDFNKANKLAKQLEKHNIITYLYTNNQELSIDKLINSHITVNFSYDTEREDTKETAIIENNEIKKAIKDDDSIICSGKCFNCSYCKNKKDLRKVKFIRHGKGLPKIDKQLKETLTYKQFNELIANKFIDYGLFLKNKS